MVDFIYARQSTDKEDSISIESQNELCLREVGNDQYKVFREVPVIIGLNQKHPTARGGLV